VHGCGELKEKKEKYVSSASHRTEESHRLQAMQQDVQPLPFSGFIRQLCVIFLLSARADSSKIKTNMQYSGITDASSWNTTNIRSVKRFCQGLGKYDHARRYRWRAETTTDGRILSRCRDVRK
jgi:hypothetical protein